MGSVALEGFGSGGGAALNFKVVGNPQPENPKENAIWVNTDVPIPKWYFDANQPESMAEGDVWFSTGTSSPIAFNALKKNYIQVYPLSAKQYIGGAWVDVEAKIYQGGAWVDLAQSVIIFENGQFAVGSCDGITNGNQYSYSKVQGEAWLIACSNSGTVIGYTTEMFDLTNISELVFTAELGAGTTGQSATVSFGVASAQKDEKFVAKHSFSANTKDKATYSIDVSSLTGKYYIKAVLNRSSSNYYHTLTISDIRSA